MRMYVRACVCVYRYTHVACEQANLSCATAVWLILDFIVAALVRIFVCSRTHTRIHAYTHTHTHREIVKIAKSNQCYLFVDWPGEQIHPHACVWSQSGFVCRNIQLNCVSHFNKGGRTYVLVPKLPTAV